MHNAQVTIRVANLAHMFIRTYFGILSSFFRHFIHAARVPRMAPHNSFETHPRPAKNTEPFDRRVRILRTTRIKSAKPLTNDISQYAVVKRQCFLIDPDKLKNNFFHIP